MPKSTQSDSKVGLIYLTKLAKQDLVNLGKTMTYPIQCREMEKSHSCQNIQAVDTKLRKKVGGNKNL